MSFIYGPVPSRRLGFSLGVDLVPYKTCTLNCVYCQLGRTTVKTIRRKEYAAKKEVLKDIKKGLRNASHINWITFAGSGEPTLNSEIGGIIAGIKGMTDIPVAVLTNGTLLYRKGVRKDLMKADLVIPSLDSASMKGFKRVNRPHPLLDLKKIIDGIVKFRSEFKGTLWLEVMLVKGFNDTERELDRLREVIKDIGPDKVHLNTVVRPPAEKSAGIVNDKRVRRIAGKFGKECDIIYDVKWEKKELFINDISETIFEMIRRRPVTVRDISNSLGIRKDDIIKDILILEKLGMIKTEMKNGRTYLKEDRNE